MPLKLGIARVILLHPIGEGKKRYKKSFNFVKMYSPKHITNKGETPMSILANLHVPCNTPFDINFDGGNLSSDAGLLLFHAFIDKMKLRSLCKKSFKTKDKAKRQQYSNIKVEKITETVASA